MSLRIPLAVSLILASFAVQAQDPAPAFNGDAQRGKELAYTCNGCHAISNYKNVYPTYSVPKLHGQRPQYLVAALKAYKSGERSHGTMHSQAASLDDTDMADLAAFLAGGSVLSESKSDVPAERRPKASEVCVACHGTNGVGITPDYPTIAGQHRDYIMRALTDYKRGGRKNAVMAGMAANLSQDDIEALATFYSTRKPALSVVPKRTSFLSSDARD